MLPLKERVRRLNLLILQRRIEARSQFPHFAKLAHFDKRIGFYRGWIELDPYLQPFTPDPVKWQQTIEVLKTYTG